MNALVLPDFGPYSLNFIFYALVPFEFYPVYTYYLLKHEFILIIFFESKFQNQT